MLRLARERGHVKVVNDQAMSPTATADVARMLLRMVSERCDVGTYHVVNSGCATWCEFAREIFAQAGVDAHVTPCGSEDFPSRALRPRYSVLSTRKVAARFGALRSWQEGLGRYLSEVGPVQPLPAGVERCSGTADGAHDRRSLAVVGV